MQDRLRRVAEGPYWRYPTLILNQVNWYAEVYNAAALATGNPVYLQRDLRGQFAALVRSIRSPAPNTAGSLGPGMQFHYLPHALPTSKLNIESAEYANIVASVVRFYDSAIARGMQPLPAADEALLRRWMTPRAGRLLDARRLHELGHGLQLRALAPDEEVRALPAGADRDRRRRAAVALARRGVVGQAHPRAGFELYERKLPEGEGVAPGLFYPLKPKPQSNKQALFAASRMAANVARAVAAGLPARPGSEPPALYSFDPAVGRLAVTTPALQHGDHRRHQRRLSVRRDRPRAALRRPPGGRRHARRPRARRPSASSRATATAGSGSPPRAPPPAAPAAAAAAARAARRRQRGLDPAAVRRPVRRPARDRPARRRRRRRALDLHVPPQLDHRRVDGARHHAPAPQRRGAVPEHRRRAGGRVGAAARRPGRAR